MPNEEISHFGTRPLKKPGKSRFRFLAIIILAVLLIILGWYAAGLIQGGPEDDVIEDGENTVLEPEPLSEYFAKQLEMYVVSSKGQPIEGFEPFMFLETFPRIVPLDFKGVVAWQGTYEIQDRGIIFIDDSSEIKHSAGRAITPIGMEKLYLNITERIGIVPATISDVDLLIRALLENNMEAGATSTDEGIL